MLFSQGGKSESNDELPVTEKQSVTKKGICCRFTLTVWDSRQHRLDLQLRLLVCNTETNGTEKANIIIYRRTHRGSFVIPQ